LSQTPSVEISHTSNTPVFIDDFVNDGDTVTIEKNITFFKQTFDNTRRIEFIVLPNQDGKLCRIYMNWFRNLSPELENIISEFPTYEAFFKQHVGLKLKVTATTLEREDEFGRIINFRQWHLALA
jgi:hypothetical protein